MIRRMVVPLCAASLVLSACTDANSSAVSQQAEEAVRCSYPAEQSPAKPVDPPTENNVAAAGTTTATIELSAGEVTITLDRAAAPCTVNSFLSLAEQGYFDDTRCHRLLETGGFILQCGDPTGTGMGGPGYTLPDETTGGETYPAGTVAMANRGEDAATGGSQFFLVWGDSDFEPHYTVFGTMDQAGIDVIGGIAAQGVDAADGETPIADATITSVIVG
ncbi:MAG: peptidylprolyl isomerase [Arachnia sp.]